MPSSSTLSEHPACASPAAGVRKVLNEPRRFLGLRAPRNAQAAPQRGEVNVTVFSRTLRTAGATGRRRRSMRAVRTRRERTAGIHPALWARRGAAAAKVAGSRRSERVAQRRGGVAPDGVAREPASAAAGADRGQRRRPLDGHGRVARRGHARRRRHGGGALGRGRVVFRDGGGAPASLAFRGVRRLPQSVTVGGDALEALANPPAALGQRGLALLSGEQAVEVPEGPLVLPPGTLLVALGAGRVSEEVRVVVAVECRVCECVEVSHSAAVGEALARDVLEYSTRPGIERVQDRYICSRAT